jgi:hypothetical protein
MDCQNVGAGGAVLLTGLALTVWGWNSLRDREAAEAQERCAAIASTFPTSPWCT